MNDDDRVATREDAMDLVVYFLRRAHTCLERDDDGAVESACEHALTWTRRAIDADVARG